MTLTASKTLPAEWSTGVQVPGNWLYGAMDEHLPVRSDYRCVTRFSLDWSGIYSIINAQVIITLTAGTHIGHTDGHYAVQRVTSGVPVRNRYSTICGGTGWNDDTSFTVDDWCEGYLPSANAYWQYSCDITSIVNNWKSGAPNYGLAFTTYGAFEYWSATAGTRTGSTSYRPYININYETSPNRAPNQPWVYDVGGYGGGVVIPNNTTPVVTAVCTGDADNDPVSAMSFRWAQTSGNGVEGWSTGYGDSGAANFWWDGGNYRANVTPTLTAGKWYNFQTAAMDHHGAWTSWGGTQWNYINKAPDAPTVS